MTAFLKFSKGNRKVGPDVAVFSIPAGHTCPAANLCLSRADRGTGLIKDGRRTEFRCFAASIEALRTNVRNAVWHNLDLLKATALKDWPDLLHRSVQRVPRNTRAVRIHSHGDFFNETYFLAWKEVARRNPDLIFYGYTKQIGYLLKHGQVDGNFRIVASVGGKHDNLITPDMVSARVVMSNAEAVALGLPVDHDDTHAQRCDRSFALRVHGTQPKGSDAAKAAYANRKASH